MGSRKKLVSQLKTREGYTRAELDLREAREKKVGEFAPLSPQAPITMGPIATDEWARIVANLGNIPATALDQTMLIMYCHYYEIFVNAVQATSTGEPLHTGARFTGDFKVLNEAAKELRAIAEKLGLTISSRLQLIVSQEEENKGNDPFAPL